MLINGVSNYYNMLCSYKISNGSQASCKVFNIRREASDRRGRRTNANVKLIISESDTCTHLFAVQKHLNHFKWILMLL